MGKDAASGPLTRQREKRTRETGVAYLSGNQSGSSVTAGAR